MSVLLSSLKKEAQTTVISYKLEHIYRRGSLPNPLKLPNNIVCIPVTGSVILFGLYTCRFHQFEDMASSNKSKMRI